MADKHTIVTTALAAILLVGLAIACCVFLTPPTELNEQAILQSANAHVFYGTVEADGSFCAVHPKELTLIEGVVVRKADEFDSWAILWRPRLVRMLIVPARTSETTIQSLRSLPDVIEVRRHSRDW